MGFLMVLVAVPVVYGAWRFLISGLDREIEGRWNQEAPFGKADEGRAPLPERISNQADVCGLPQPRSTFY